MKCRYMPAAVAAVSVLVAPTSLVAQTATTSSDADTKTYVEIEDDTLLVGPFNVSVDELDEFDVIDISGNKVGEIEKVLADSSGVPVAVVIEREGRADDEEEDIVVSLDRLELAGSDLQMDIAGEDLESLPRWDD